ncbi:hypothetical protein FI667_g12837, partial [Globisporangium splendens]
MEAADLEARWCVHNGTLAGLGASSHRTTRARHSAQVEDASATVLLTPVSFKRLDVLSLGQRQGRRSAASATRQRGWHHG